MITLTELAATKVKEKLAQRGRGLGIRIGVKTTGCSGFAYVLEYFDRPDSTMAVFDCDGAKIWIDPGDFPYLKGMTVDWVKSGLNEGFEFINANEKSRCGCGSSFKV